MSIPQPESWLSVTPKGPYCAPGDFYVDPASAVPRAVITHGHADHARPGHATVLTTDGTAAIMRAARSRSPSVCWAGCCAGSPG